MNPLTDLSDVLIGELGTATVMFLTWIKHSKLIGFTGKAGFPS